MSLQSYKLPVHTNVDADNRITTLVCDKRFGMGDVGQRLSKLKFALEKVTKAHRGSKRLSLLFL